MSKEMGFCTDCTRAFLNVHVRAGPRTLNKYIIVVYLQVDTIIKSSAPALEELVVAAWIDSHCQSFDSANGKLLNLKFQYCPLALFLRQMPCATSPELVQRPSVIIK